MIHFHLGILTGLILAFLFIAIAVMRYAWKTKDEDVIGGILKRLRQTPSGKGPEEL